MEKKEVRNYEFEMRIETRDDNTKSIVGHGAVFNQMSENLGGFREVIEQGAFDGVLNDDVRALFNHDSNIVLGRTKSGTLKIGVDEKGLFYEINPPDTTDAKNLMTLLDRGDISQSSFGFYVDKDRWVEDDSGVIRYIERIRQLVDVSPVTFPAYPQTDAAKRSLEEYLKTKEKPVDDKKTINRWLNYRLNNLLKFK